MQIPFLPFTVQIDFLHTLEISWVAWMFTIKTLHL
jgi:hypothetical protein